MEQGRQESHVFDPELHEEGSVAARGECSHHAAAEAAEGCSGQAVVSYQDRDGAWQSGCSRALEELVERGEIEPLGQGA